VAKKGGGGGRDESLHLWQQRSLMEAVISATNGNSPPRRAPPSTCSCSRFPSVCEFRRGFFEARRRAKSAVNRTSEGQKLKMNRSLKYYPSELFQQGVPRTPRARLRRRGRAGSQQQLILLPRACACVGGPKAARRRPCPRRRTCTWLIERCRDSRRGALPMPKQRHESIPPQPAHHGPHA
jgi:hypothetical protein